MSSGVAVNPVCQATFQKMAEGKKEYRYIIFKVEDKEVTIDKAVAREEMQSRNNDDYADNSKMAYEEFLTDLKTVTDGFKDCRYAVFDFKFSGHREGAGVSKTDKIVFLQICPDGASIKKKMVYASSAQAIKAALGTGKMIPIQVSDESEMSHRTISDILSGKYSDRK